MPNPPGPSGPLAYGILAGYLLDEVSPEEAASAVPWLAGEPVEAIARQVFDWANEKSTDAGMPIEGFLLYGIEKFYILGERNLVHKGGLSGFLDRIVPAVVGLAPAAGQSWLQGRVAAMRTSGITQATHPTKVAAKAAPQEIRLADTTRKTMKAEKQLALILERYGKGAKKKKSEEAEALEAAQILTIAATSSKTAAQFEDLLAEIERTTGRKKGNVFATLGGGLPAWDIPIPAAGVEKVPPAQVAAMGKIIQLAENPAVALERVRELVTAAVEKFNAGSLAAAMWMFDVAEDGIKEKKVAPAAVERIREEAVSNLSGVQIRKYAENRSKHSALRIVLEFFPSMRLDALFAQLRGETRAERRRALLGIIETHGAAARELALAKLEAELAQREVDTYYLRNLIYVLHRVPREGDETVPRLLAALTRASAKGQNIYVIKEAATALGQIKTEDSVKVLTTVVAEMEVMLSRNDVSLYPVTEMQKTLDRAIGSIARIGTLGALLTVARHGMKTNPALGDTRAHFSILAEQDLSFHGPVLDILMKALRDEIPGKLLGRLISKKQESTIRLIDALSGTRSDDLTELLREIAERFPDQDLGRAAAKLLAKRGAGRGAGGAEPAATLSGELEFFGIPAVLQSLAEMRATGVLTISTKQGEIVARMVVAEGMFVDAQKGKLRGVDGFYEILERPVPGRFAFVPYPAERLKSSGEPQSVVGLLFEAVRRQDELQLMMTVVPDDLPLAATGAKPTAPEGEQDPSLMREVWMKAAAGSPVGEWAAEIPTDSFRIRRLLSHWLESGALAARA